MQSPLRPSAQELGLPYDGSYYVLADGHVAPSRERGIPPCERGKFRIVKLGSSNLRQTPDPHLVHESRSQASGNAAPGSPPSLRGQPYCSLCHPITSSWPGVSEDSLAPSRGVLDAEGACHTLSCMGVVVLATLVGGGARDYHITRAPTPTIAFSCDGWALAAIPIDGMAGTQTTTHCNRVFTMIS